MRAIVTIVAAGSGLFVGANLPDAALGECELADAVIHRSDATMIDTDGEVTGGRLWLVCGYQYPNSTGGVVNKDDSFVLELDGDTSAIIVEASEELVD